MHSWDYKTPVLDSGFPPYRQVPFPGGRRDRESCHENHQEIEDDKSPPVGSVYAVEQSRNRKEDPDAHKGSRLHNPEKAGVSAPFEIVGHEKGRGHRTQRIGKAHQHGGEKQQSRMLREEDKQPGRDPEGGGRVQNEAARILTVRDDSANDCAEGAGQHHD